MKKLSLLVLVGMFAVAPVYAESALELCTAEAKDAGIEDREDFRAYVDECVEQVSAEMSANREAGEAPEEAAQDSESPRAE